MSLSHETPTQRRHRRWREDCRCGAEHQRLDTSTTRQVWYLGASRTFAHCWHCESWKEIPAPRQVYDEPIAENGLRRFMAGG